MDRASIEDLWQFTDYSWRTYEELIRPLGNEMLTKAAPGSGWPALSDALGHTNAAYVRWLTDPAQTTEMEGDPVKSWDDLDAFRQEVRGHARQYLDSLSDEELAARREMNVDGKTLRYSPAEIFTHVLLHERQHHGDVNTLLYQLGIDPPVVEYRFSLRG